jgi:hypothetical protein
LKAAWEWVKKHWELLGAAILVLLGFLLGVTVRKRPVVLEGANPEKEDAEKKAQSDTRKAEQDAAEQKAEAKKQHDVDTAGLVTEVQQKTEEVRHDPQKTNEYLLNVGKDIRGDE